MSEQGAAIASRSGLTQLVRAALVAVRRAIVFVFGPVLHAPTRRRPRGGRPLGMLVAGRARVVVPVAIAVPATFARRDYVALLQALAVPGPKLLDLSSARSIQPDLFTALASEWAPNPELVPRLAIVLTFKQWAVLRGAAALQLAPLRARGVEVELFYTEQTLDDRLLPWFEHGKATHNVAAVLTTLRRWQPSPISPVVLEAVATLVYQAVAAGAPASHIIDLAAISLASGANIKALSFAREALLHLGEVASIERLEALRVLGFALMAEGRVVGATSILDGTIAMAVGLGQIEDAADLLRQLGCGELDRGNVAGAEERFRTALELLSPGKSELLASLHHNLAIALLNQRKDGAEVHATIALASRPASDCPGAQMDLQLLRNIRSGRGLAS